MYDDLECPHCGDEIEYEELHMFYHSYDDDRLMPCQNCNKLIKIGAEEVLEFYLEKGQ